LKSRNFGKRKLRYRAEAAPAKAAREGFVVSGQPTPRGQAEAESGAPKYWGLKTASGQS
jgi:hypothetical protein